MLPYLENTQIRRQPVAQRPSGVLSRKAGGTHQAKGISGLYRHTVMLCFILILVIFKLLAILRPLRDTKLDLFGLSKERRIEKKIIGLYEKDLGFIFQNFCSEKKNILIDLAKNPSNIKGFGISSKSDSIKISFSSQLLRPLYT